ncbi:Putative SET domain, tetratricopeptide-like helical domain superfamily, SET domain superfamily [Colletotrichum destructivum]|uniref:SET domain, tetratricopeptide-like helical domain superfamily, SET domain superfamily n=1 Tax=Colletotrichum destructivum TaxID=34406 RepID=A0AAX4ILR8_9PEZI|nr:Putative SET domain, tetratricopeptide-like helical domain superfamily, SET domain superfamily [Colletotrichum destructivum]
MAHQNGGNTVLLTEQEAQRIRATVRETRKQCVERKGNAREFRDAHATVSQATGTSLMMDMGSMAGQGQRDTLPALGVGQTYPPSTASLQDLKPMKFTELQMETHHRGRSLIVKRASRCPVVTLAARSWTVVQDEEEKETERLEICLHKTTDGEDTLESARRYIIKEPYFTLTEDGEATLRIDHPSDLVVCQDEIVKGSSTQVEDAEKGEALAKKCKDKGNAALQKKDLPLTRESYSQGLKLARQEAVQKTNPDLARDIARNRAHVHLLLDRQDEAIADAKASLIGADDQRSKELDSKAYFRAGSGAYNLGQYQQAKEYFEQAKKLAPEEKGAAMYLRKVEMRLREEKEGNYDLQKIRANLTPASPRADAASFTSKTEVKESVGRGRGLFATRDIAAGEIVMVEKAFCVVWGHESEVLTAMTYDVRDDRIRVAPVGLTKAISQKLLRNSSQIARVMDLYGDYQGEGDVAATKTEEGAVVDVFRVHDIVSRNAFGPGGQYGEEGARNASTGLWIWAAYINHSCIANAKKEYVGDLMVLRALRAIKKGEEIFHSYDESADYEARQKALLTTWGFECGCALCAAEKTDDDKLRRKRQTLANDADDFVNTTHWTNAKRIAISKAQRFARDIDATYDDKKYDGVPRLASARVREWLAKATPLK